MKVASLVVTYNRKELLQECLNALFAQTYSELDICVIDNGSTDGTFEYLKQVKKNGFFYYNTGENLGGAGGFNYGLKKLVERDYDYVWIMDDDTIPKENALDILMKSAQYLKGNFGLLASSVISTDNTFCKMNNPGILRDTLLGTGFRDLGEGICKINYASFVSILIPYKVIMEIGFPIKEFFIWKDDYEYTTRISNRYPCYYIAKSEVVHKIKNNMLPNISSDSFDRIERYFYEFRNGYYVVRKKGLRTKMFYYYNIIKSIKSIVLYSNNYKMKRIKTVLKGLWAGWFFNPPVEYKK